MFDLDTFISDCRVAAAETEPRLAIKELLSRALTDPAGIEAAIPVSEAELSPLYQSDDLTIMKVIWAPGMQLPPHDHLMWAAIGIFGGQEDNTFFRRDPQGLVASGGKQLVTGDTVLLGDDTVHAVVNPRRHAYTAAIHIYGGDFIRKPRHMWDPETMEELPATAATMRRYFDEANARSVN
ncbi:MAG TPA: cysteine dioxygenase family protein [Acidimicrobiales bacterium]|nr:cysteine dioxygenase family protein [Acidimicrobiales bacterium]